MGDGTAEDKAAGFDPRDLIDFVAGEGLDQFVDRAAEGAGIAEQGRDVTKQDPRLGIIGDGADGVAQ